MGSFRKFAMVILFAVAFSPLATVFAQTATPTPTATPDYRTFVQIGAVELLAGAPPSSSTGWLVCDGSAVSRTTYASLFAAIGTTFGAGDGSTTFNLPDLRGRVPVGSGAGTDLTARTLGQSFGEETHTLTVTEMPSHSHGVNDSGHSHSIPVGSGGSGSFDNISHSNQAGLNSTRNTGVSQTGITIQNTGGGAAFNQMQPSLVVNYVIWAGTVAMPSIVAEETIVITVVVVFPTHTPTPTYTPTYTPSPTLTVTPGPSPTPTPTASPTVSTSVSYSVGTQAVMVDYTVTPGDAANTALLVIIVFILVAALFFYFRGRGSKS